LLNNELKDYKKIAAIDSDIQVNRITLVKTAESLGFDAIELDEQLLRDTLTVEEYNELKTNTTLKIGITSCPDPILTFIFDKGGVPDFICLEVYIQTYVDAIPYVVSKVSPIPVIGVINIADPQFDSSMIPTWVEIVLKGCAGLWIWGWQTGNPEWQSIAEKNYALIEPILKPQDLNTCSTITSSLKVVKNLGLMTKMKAAVSGISNVGKALLLFAVAVIPPVITWLTTDGATYKMLIAAILGGVLAFVVKMLDDGTY
jgi:hypothetical protein